MFDPPKEERDRVLLERQSRDRMYKPLLLL